jgi:hypothetical protein
MYYNVPSFHGVVTPAGSRGGLLPHSHVTIPRFSKRRRHEAAPMRLPLGVTANLFFLPPPSLWKAFETFVLQHEYRKFNSFPSSLSQNLFGALLESSWNCVVRFVDRNFLPLLLYVNSLFCS